MMNFCTLFDSYYIHKGIATYLSLEKLTDNFHLYVMAFDKDCYNKLKQIGFKHMTVELVDDFETPELLKVKPTRNKAEYCWTCGPSVIMYFMKKYNLPNITYIDADLYFMSSPQVLFDEIGDNSIGLTEHNNIDSSKSGRFCVQYNFFKNDLNGITALKWWRDSCIEWCYARFENGKMGDQRYLDAFPDKFNRVYIVKNRGAGIASWNIERYKYEQNSLSFCGKSYPFVFFHMHGVNIEVKNSKLIIKSEMVPLTAQTKSLFFEPYAKLLKDVYIEYLKIPVEETKIVKMPFYRGFFIKLRQPFRHNKFMGCLYYKVLNRRYKGTEKKQI